MNTQLNTSCPRMRISHVNGKRILALIGNLTLTGYNREYGDFVRILEKPLNAIAIESRLADKSTDYSVRPSLG